MKPRPTDAKLLAPPRHCPALHFAAGYGSIKIQIKRKGADVYETACEMDGYDAVPDDTGT